MHAMRLHAPRTPLRAERVSVPEPGPGQVLIQVCACAVCRTDLHVVDGELPDPVLPIVPGHEIVGRVAAIGAGVDRFAEARASAFPGSAGPAAFANTAARGARIFARAPASPAIRSTAAMPDTCVADARFCFPIPAEYDDVSAAPLLCAGLIGWRTLRMAGEGRRLGIYGFGAAAHIIAQVARHQGREIYAFTRAGRRAAQEFARSLGAVWAGGSDQAPPEPLDAALIFAPVGALVPAALRAVKPGGTVVCGGIHMSDIPAFPYELLWQERTLRSVANLTRQDAEEFLALAPSVPVRTETHIFRSRKRTRRFRHCGTGGSRVRRCWCRRRPEPLRSVGLPAASSAAVRIDPMRDSVMSMVALAKTPVRMSVAEFLNWNPGDGRRWQLIDGEAAGNGSRQCHAWLSAGRVRGG